MFQKYHNYKVGDYLFVTFRRQTFLTLGSLGSGNKNRLSAKDSEQTDSVSYFPG
jgi:hypothetical protein